jgi:hypothetical protein
MLTYPHRDREREREPETVNPADAVKRIGAGIIAEARSLRAEFARQTADISMASEVARQAAEMALSAMHVHEERRNDLESIWDKVFEAIRQVEDVKNELAVRASAPPGAELIPGSTLGAIPQSLYPAGNQTVLGFLYSQLSALDADTTKLDANNTFTGINIVQGSVSTPEIAYVTNPSASIFQVIDPQASGGVKFTITKNHGLGSIMGVHINRASTTGQAHGIAWDMDDLVSWGTGIDADGTGGGVGNRYYVDFVPLYSGLLQADIFRFSQRPLANGGIKFVIGQTVGSPVNQGWMGTIVSAPNIGGLIIQNDGATDTIRLAQQDIAVAGNKRTQINYGGLFIKGNDSASNGTKDFWLYDVTAAAYRQIYSNATGGHQFTNWLSVPAAPGSANFANISSGEAGFAGGGGTNFAGSANGTHIGINAASAFAGNLVDFQVAGVSKYSISAAGGITAATLGLTASGNPLIVNLNGDGGMRFNQAAATKRARINFVGVYQMGTDSASNNTGDLWIQNIGTGNSVLTSSATDLVTIGSNNASGGAVLGVSGGKAAFYGATPVVQPLGTTDVLASLVTLGLRAASSNPPLNLGTGALTAGAAAFSASAANPLLLNFTGAGALRLTQNDTTKRTLVNMNGVFQFGTDSANNATLDFWVQNIGSGNTVLSISANDLVTVGSSNALGGAVLGVASGKIGFFGGTAVVKPAGASTTGIAAVTDAAAKAAILAINTALVALGLVSSVA